MRPAGHGGRHHRRQGGGEKTVNLSLNNNNQTIQKLPSLEKKGCGVQLLNIEILFEKSSANCKAILWLFLTNTYFQKVKSSPHVATVELGGTLTRGMMVVDQRVDTILVRFDFDVLKGWHNFGVFWY